MHRNKSFFSALIVNAELSTSTHAGQTVPWWSFSKTVLAATALTLVRDGLIDLDETLPEGAFTLRQLLRHEAGLGDYGALADYHVAVANDESAWSAAEMLRRVAAAGLHREPGSEWRYSNVGYWYIASIVERVTGETLAEAMAQRMLRPLGLTAVRIACTRADLNDVAMGDCVAYDPGWVYQGLLVGPLTQAAQFLDRLLGGDLLPDVLINEMQTTRTLGGPILGRPWQVPGYGLGLMCGEICDGVTARGHTGCGPGSTIAVFRCVLDAHAATCAVWRSGDDQGGVEREALRQIFSGLGMTASDSVINC